MYHPSHQLQSQYQLRFSLFSFCTFATILFLLVPQLHGQSSEQLKQRFLDEAPDRWREYQAFIERLEGKMTRQYKSKNEIMLHYQSEYKHNKTCRLITSQSLLNKPSEGEVRAYNPSYAFHLKRKSKVQPWVVIGFSIDQGAPDNAIVKRTSEGLIPLRCLIQAHTEDLSSLVRQPTFRVIRATPVKRDSAELVKIEFDNSHSLKTGREFCPIQAGSLLFDPNRYWCLRECDLRCKFSDGDARVKAHTEFSVSPGGYPIPRRNVDITEVISSTHGNWTQVWVTDYDLREASHFLPDKEFTLSAFGLSEPFEVGSPTPRWYIWVGLAGVVCLVLGAIFHWKRQRAARPTLPV